MKQIITFAKNYNTTMTRNANKRAQYQRNLNSRAETTKPLEGYERLHELAKEAELQKILKQEKINYISRIQGIPPVNRNSKQFSLGLNVIKRLKQRD